MLNKVASVAAPEGNGKALALMGTGVALSCASVRGPVTLKGEVSLESMLTRLALPLVCRAEVLAPVGSTEDTTLTLGVPTIVALTELPGKYIKVDAI